MYTELLAPAKDKETAIEAINCGADAVYIGASAFGARQNAYNSLDDIKDVIDYAHKFYVKVYITVNTILDDNELEQAVELIKKLDKMNADAVLIQDMGLLNKLINLHEQTNICIHASTQCDNRELEKIKFFNNIGISRVVLARELSLDKIKQIHEQVPNIELEAFIHGALCVSYSGQCYLSQFMGGRSANRGECAQPCRKKYTVLDDMGNIIKKDFYALSLKDFNASNHIKEMFDSGIYSFKIEGRLKDTGYVKNVVSYYRQELDKYSEKSSSGKSTYSFTPDVERSFNRGFTDYFLKERTECYNQYSPKSRGKYIGIVKRADKNSIFIETGMDIHNQDGLCFIQDEKMDGFLVNKVQKTANGYIVYPNKSIYVKSGVKIYRNLDVEFEKELLKPVKRQIGVNVSVDNNIITVKDEDGTSISYKIDSTEKANNQQKMNETFIKQFSKTGDSDFYILDFNITSDIPFMPISVINELRRGTFSKLMHKRLSLYKREKQKKLKYSEYYLKELDYRANVHNKNAEEFYTKCGSIVKEMSMETKVPTRQIELMRTKHCIKYALNMCKSPKNLILKDENGIEFPLKFDCKKCEMAVLSPTKQCKVY